MARQGEPEEPLDLALGHDRARARQPPRYVGSHRHEGIFALSGPSATNAGRSEIGIADVAPTVLYLLGEPLPADLEGRLVAEAIDPALLDRRPPEYDDSGPFELERVRGTRPRRRRRSRSASAGLGYIE